MAYLNGRIRTIDGGRTPLNDDNDSELEVDSDTNESVIQEANDVFSSFINGVVPGSQNVTAHLPGRNNIIGRRLAEIGDAVLREHGGVFTELSRMLTQPNGNLSRYRDFVDVVSSLFSDGINWGRILVLMAFGCFVVITFMNRRIVQNILGYVLRYLKEKISGWITRHGGWITAPNGAVSNMKSASPLVMCVTSCIAAFKAMISFFSRK
uniref:Bcl-2 Bcl-2 homology region 1-3 domain-containing protein n=1 Tax=Magallana gigas TaxID=29159 RepID=A0A8W8JQN3_MAGGI